MKDKIFYYSGNIAVGDRVSISGEEFVHLSLVLRGKVGDSITIICGDGFFYGAKLLAITKKSADALIVDLKKSDNEPSISLTLFQALVKGDKLSLITQKISELGASKLSLFESKFCDVKSNTHKPERLGAIAISAAKQCGRATLLETNGSVLTVPDVMKQIKNYDAFFVAYENSDGKTLAEYLTEPEAKKLKNVAVMVGSEGGFDSTEIDMLVSAGAKVVSLGRRILRTETAAICATALVMQILD